MTEFFEQIAQFHFLRPLWLLAILPASLLVILLWRRKTLYGTWEAVISPHLLPHLMKGNAGGQSRSALVLLLLAWLLACLALAGPTWRQLPTAAQKKIQAQVIVLDLSISMYATDLPPSRLKRARMKLTDILKRAEEDLTALVVFAGSPHVVTPLTDDANTIQSMVESLDPAIMPIKGSDAAAAVQKALEVLRQGGVDSGRILLITDSVPDDFVSRLEPLVSGNASVSILGIGTAAGAPIPLPDGTFVKDSSGSIAVPKLDVSSLKKAARQLGGRFSTLSSNDDDINYLLARTNPFGDQQIKDTHREFDVWDEAGPWLVLLLLPLAAAGYRRGWLGALLLPLLATLLSVAPRPAQAFEWADLWRTPDQQAQELLGEGQAAEATKKFTRPDWKGASAYKGGDFETAAQQFRQLQDSDGYYNLGNSLTQLDQLDDAIAAYDKALELNPDNEDAAVNREIVKKRKQQQQEQQGNGNSNQNNKDQQKSDQQDSKQNQQQNQQQDQQSGQQDQQHQQDGQQQDQPQQNQQEQQGEQQPEQDQQGEKDAQRRQNQQDEGQQPEDGKNQPQPRQSEQEDGEADDQPPSSAHYADEPLQSEDQQALEQWLRRVPDDPGGLLRRKFERETQLRKHVPGGDSSW